MKNSVFSDDQAHLPLYASNLQPLLLFWTAFF